MCRHEKVKEGTVCIKKRKMKIIFSIEILAASAI